MWWNICSRILGFFIGSSGLEGRLLMNWWPAPFGFRFGERGWVPASEWITERGPSDMCALFLLLIDTLKPLKAAFRAASSYAYPLVCFSLSVIYRRALVGLIVKSPEFVFLSIEFSYCVFYLLKFGFISVMLAWFIVMFGDTPPTIAFALLILLFTLLKFFDA